MIGIIIQARTTSTRFPKKVIMPLPCTSEISVLEQVIKRAKASKLASSVIIATTDNSSDYPIIKIAKKTKTDYYCGDEDNVLSRYYHCAKEYALNTIVRITSDCPCIDPAIIDLVINAHIESGADYTSNGLTRTFPRGQDVEVFQYNCLEDTFNKAKTASEKEHVTLYMYSNPDSHYKLQGVEASHDLSDPNLRITLDTEEDYALLCAIFDFLYPQNPLFDLKSILSLVRARPWLKLINKKIVQKQLALQKTLEPQSNSDALFEFNHRFLYPLKREHLSLIKEWRNAQMDVLRQWKPLSDQDQKVWFDRLREDTTQFIFVIKAMNSNKQLALIGYCGITHIDEKNKRGEISFLVDPSRAKNEELYSEDFLSTLYMLCKFGFEKVVLHKLFTETFEFRKHQIDLLDKCGFQTDGKLRDHEFVHERFHNSVIQSILVEEWPKIKKEFKKSLGIDK